MHRLELVDVVRLKNEYDKATNSMGGAMTYHFSKWLEHEDIKPTSEKFRPAWMAAQVEAKVLNIDTTPQLGQVTITILTCLPPI